MTSIPDSPPTYPRTPDGRYFMARGRLWRTTNPRLTTRERDRLVRQLMRARRDIAQGDKTTNAALVADARQRVRLAKLALGERGPVWWGGATPDYNRRLARETPYREWSARLLESGN